MSQMGRFGLALSLFGLAALATAGQPEKNEPVDYAELSRLIHKIAVAQVAKTVEDNSGWGQTVPVPDRLPLPRLKRTLVKVGDRWELPHGVWRKVKAWLPEPARDLQIHVRELKPAGPGTFRLVLDADVALRGWAEVQHWQNGLALVGFIGEADAVIGLHLVCDVGIAFDTKKFPPEVKVTPKVAELKSDLREFALREVKLRRLAVKLEGDAAREAGNQFKGILQELMRSQEAKVKELANQAIERSLREGKGNLNAASLMKLLSPPSKDTK